MTIPGIWTKDDEVWKLSRPEGFPDEATLHSLIEETPEMLPLAGAPRLMVLGREVLLGSGYADLLGVEASGRPVITEIKLARNNEARRAVVAQVLAYAAYLHSMTREQLESQLRRNLRDAGHNSMLDAVAAADDEGSFDPEGFTAALDDHLREGRFRLVFVLDAAPPELMTLIAYLEHVTDKLVIDLVAVSAFEVNSALVMLPQRVTPERHEIAVEQTRRTESETSYQGSDEFEASIGDVSEEHQDDFRRLLEWARGLEQRDLVYLKTTRGVGGRRLLLKPILKAEKKCLVIIWNQDGPSITFYRTVFQDNVPDFIEKVEGIIGSQLKRGNSTRVFSEELLQVLTEAYEQAAK